MGPPTTVVVDHVLQALEGEAGGDVVPAVVQPVDPVVLHTPVLHRQRVHTCGQRHRGSSQRRPTFNGVADASGAPPERLLGAAALLTSLSAALSHHEGAHSVLGQAEQLLGLLPLHPLEQPPGAAQQRRIAQAVGRGNAGRLGAAPTRGRPWRRSWPVCSSPAGCGRSGLSTSRPPCPPERGIVLRKLVRPWRKRSAPPCQWRSRQKAPSYWATSLSFSPIL